MLSSGEHLLSRRTLLFVGFVILLSYLTYFHRYWAPSSVFWDENYHIASAQKYLHGVYFMEQHPPLGKMLVALGEVILHPNVNTSQFLVTDYGTTFEEGFSFAGYRFFSALLGWWTAPLLFLIFLLLLKDALMATLLSFLYIFDNALIVHLRGAMLEGPLLFFCALMLLTFFLIREYKERKRAFIWLSLLLGISFALVIATKLLGMLLFLLVPAVCWMLLPYWKKIGQFLLLFAIGLVVPYVAIWHTHFALGKRIEPLLPDRGYYQASAEYRKILAEGRSGSIFAFPVMLRDSWRFVSHYNSGAPRLDLCKPDENGSPWYFWPFGARAINYRWESAGNKYRYLYLQSNPVVWFTGLAAVLLAAGFLASSVLLPLREPLRNRFLLTVFLGMYVSFFISVSRIERVLYLYHYFIPLLLTFILTALVIIEIRALGKRVLNESDKTLGLLGLAGLIFLSFHFYRPLTYYEPISDRQLQRRAIVPLWELTCVRCEKKSGLVIPREAR